MLSKLKKKFHAVKYVYSIQIDKLEPWPCDDKPVCVFWKRGSKKSKKGQTEPRLAVQLDGQPNTSRVVVQQAFDLSATLYSGSSKTKLTGPYQRKDCMFSVVQMTSDGDLVHALLGTAVLNLADIARCHEGTTVEIPLNCEAEIKGLVGRPKLLLNCRIGRGNDSTSFVPFPKMISDIPSDKNDVTVAATISDLSSMSNEATKDKKLGVLTPEQQTSLEGFDGRTSHLVPIQEVMSPKDSITEMESDSAQDLEELESGKEASPAQQHVFIVAEAPMSIITEETAATDEVTQRTDEVTERAAEDIEDSAHSEEHEEHTSVKPQPQMAADNIVEADVKSLGSEMSLTAEPACHSNPKPEHLSITTAAEIASIMDSYWLTGRFNPSAAKPEKCLARNSSTDWWPMVVSLLTCMPAKPKEL